MSSTSTSQRDYGHSGSVESEISILIEDYVFLKMCD